MLHLTNENFNKTVNENSKVLVDFYADWCGPCKMIAPIIEELEGELDDVLVCKVNVDNAPDLAVLFKIEYIPTVVYIKNGQLEATLTGLKTKADILGMIK